MAIDPPASLSSAVPSAGEEALLEGLALVRAGLEQLAAVDCGIVGDDAVLGAWEELERLGRVRSARQAVLLERDRRPGPPPGRRAQFGTDHGSVQGQAVPRRCSPPGAVDAGLSGSAGRGRSVAGGGAQRLPRRAPGTGARQSASQPADARLGRLVPRAGQLPVLPGVRCAGAGMAAPR